MTQDSGLLRPAYLAATQQIKRYVENGVQKDEEKHAEIVASTIRSYIAAKNGEIARDTLKFAVNRTISSNPNEFKELVHKSLPEYTGK